MVTTDFTPLDLDDLTVDDVVAVARGDRQFVVSDAALGRVAAGRRHIEALTREIEERDNPLSVEDVEDSYRRD